MRLVEKHDIRQYEEAYRETCKRDGRSIAVNNKPVFGTTEWAASNVNIINGCSNDCKYCFSKEMSIRFKRKTPESWKQEEVNWKVYNRKVRCREGYIMFPSTHDITPEHLHLAIVFLKKLLASGNKVLIVSKPSFVCIKKVCDTLTDFKDKILFRFTIGSINSQTLKFWEPNAPDYEERKRALVYAFEHGYQTSISCEPMLDNRIDKVIDDLSQYVTDAIWLGKMNFAIRRLRTNGHLDSENQAATELLLKWQNDDAIKKLYNRYKDNPLIKWKESIKKVVGIEVSTIKGEDK